MRKELILLSLFFALPASATPVTLYSEWISGWGPGQMLLTYESSILDSDADPTHGVYDQAILDLSLTFGSNSFSLLGDRPNQLSRVVNRMSTRGVGGFASLLGSDAVFYDLAFNIEVHSLFNSGTDDLASIDGLKADELGLLMSREDGTGPRRLFAQTSAFRKVPEPGTLGLLACGLIGVLLSQRNRLRARRN